MSGGGFRKNDESGLPRCAPKMLFQDAVTGCGPGVLRYEPYKGKLWDDFNGKNALDAGGGCGMAAKRGAEMAERAAPRGFASEILEDLEKRLL